MVQDQVKPVKGDMFLQAIYVNFLAENGIKHFVIKELVTHKILILQRNNPESWIESERDFT